MKRLSLAVLAVVLAAAPVAAQPRAQKPTPAQAKPQKRVKVITIEGMDVDGDRVTRPLEPISVDQAAKSSSLIRIRRDFIDLILKAADEV